MINILSRSLIYTTTSHLVAHQVLSLSLQRCSTPITSSQIVFTMSTRASARQEAAINKAGVEARHSNLTATPSPNGNKKSTVNNGSTSEPVRSLQAKKTEEPNSQTPDLGGAAKRKRIARKAKQAASTPFDDSDILPHGLGRAGDWTMDDGAAKDDNQGMVDSTKVQEYLNTRSKCGRRAGAITTKSLESSVKPDPIATESLDTRPPKNRRKTTKVKKEDDAADDEYEAVKGKRKRASAKDISQDISNEVEEPAETTVTPAKKQRKRKSNKYGLTPGESPFPEFPMPSIEACEEVNRLLTELHGEYKPPSVIPPPSMEVTGCGEVPDLLEAILRTLLSASTTANNANLAFDGLVKKFGRTTGSSHTKSLNWEAVRQADLETVIESIKRGGLAKVKATNMKKILDTVYQQNCTRRHALLEEKRSGKQADIVGASHESVRGKESEMSRTESDMLSLDHIFELTTDEAMEEMTKLPGIGVKTSSCVILFCMKRPSFAVDTHVWRHCKWLGWVPPKATRDQTFSHCEVKVPDHLKYSLHQLFLQHGKKCARCRANTSAGTDEWQSAVCPLEHLVNRNEKRKQVISTPVKKVKIALSDKKDVQVKVFDDIEESEIEMQVESEPDQDSE